MKRMNIIARHAAAAWIAMAAATGAASADVNVALDGPADLKRSGSYVWTHAFAERLKEGGIGVRELPRGSVGGEAEILDQVSMGLIEVSLSDVKSVGKFDPLIYGVRLPYIFDDLAHMDRVLAEGDVLTRVNEAIAGSDVMLAALVPLGRPMGIFNTKKAVATPEDMADLRMRAQDDSHVRIFEAWGASATVVSWGEVPTALQTGVVDGYLQTPLVPLVFGHTDFLKEFTDVQVTIPLRAVLLSRIWYEGLSDDDRATVDAAIAAGVAATRAWQVEAREAPMAALEAAGVNITRLDAAQRAAFRAAAVPVWSSDLVGPEASRFWETLSTATR